MITPVSGRTGKFLADNTKSAKILNIFAFIFHWWNLSY